MSQHESDREYSKQRQIDDDLDAEQAEELAVRKLIHGLADYNGAEEIGPVEAAARALDRVGRIEQENERLRERVGELEAEVTPNRDAKEYNELSRDEKVQILRESLVEKGSARQNGKFAMDYNDVTWLFDGNPSAGHAYKLMKLAANAEGFEYEERGGAGNRVTVETDAVKDETLFHAVNNGRQEEAV